MDDTNVQPPLVDKTPAFAVGVPDGATRDELVAAIGLCRNAGVLVMPPGGIAVVDTWPIPAGGIVEGTVVEFVPDDNTPRAPVLTMSIVDLCVDRPTSQSWLVTDPAAVNLLRHLTGVLGPPETVLDPDEFEALTRQVDETSP